MAKQNKITSRQPKASRKKRAALDGRRRAYELTLREEVEAIWGALEELDDRLIALASGKRP